VNLVDKGARVGGRLAIGLLENENQEEFPYDKGPQFISAKSELFQQFLSNYGCTKLNSNVLNYTNPSSSALEDTETLQNGFVFKPHLNAFCESISRSFSDSVYSEYKAYRFQVKENQFRIRCPAPNTVELGPSQEFKGDALILTMPTPQILNILKQSRSLYLIEPVNIK
jgi:predicted NAD/FAD-dependent oxidoreductase